MIVGGLATAAFACAAGLASAAGTTTVAGNVANWVKSAKLMGSASAETSVTIAVHFECHQYRGAEVAGRGGVQSQEQAIWALLDAAAVRRALRAGERGCGRGQDAPRALRHEQCGGGSARHVRDGYGDSRPAAQRVQGVPESVFVPGQDPARQQGSPDHSGRAWREGALHRRPGRYIDLAAAVPSLGNHGRAGRPRCQVEHACDHAAAGGGIEPARALQSGFTVRARKSPP